jgi:aminoglycoside phosphotransferase family enzyme
LVTETTTAERAAITETHCAVVVFVGERAYKLKKPVDLGFLDFRTVDARRQACEREVVLNRRLAPDVYLGVADVIGPDGEPCDSLVVKRRMPTSRRLSTLVKFGVDVRPRLRALAEQLAAFHATARHDRQTAAEGSRDAVRERWQWRRTSRRGRRRPSSTRPGRSRPRSPPPARPWRGTSGPGRRRRSPEV